MHLTNFCYHSLSVLSTIHTSLSDKMTIINDDGSFNSPDVKFYGPGAIIADTVIF